MVIKSTTLEAPSASGKKFYVVEIVKVGPEAYTVDYRFGAVGGSARNGTLTPNPVRIEVAEPVFETQVESKINGSSHYMIVKSHEGAATSDYERPALAATNAQTVQCLSPRLLNDIDPAMIMSLVENDSWWVQIKYDGDRVQLHYRDRKVTLFSGRSKKLRGCPRAIAELVKLIGNDGSFILDGELVGETLWVFDAFEANGIDMRRMPYHRRYHWLIRLQAVLCDSPAVRIVGIAETQPAKATLIVEAKKRAAEGVVFVNKNAPYEAGRPNVGGNNLRWKFKASASVIVAKHHATKNSLHMRLFDGTDIGTVTMIGKERPPAGTVIEVEYLYAQDALVQAVFKGVRTDVPPEACTRAQLQFKDGIDPQNARKQ